MEQQRPFAVVTGASRGIGAAYAAALAADGYDVLLTARDGFRLGALADTLKRQHGGQVRVEILDLAEPDAGFGLFGPFLDHSIPRIREMVRVHVESVVESIRLFLPGMVERRSGGDCHGRVRRRLLSVAIHGGVCGDQGVSHFVHAGGGGGGAAVWCAASSVLPGQHGDGLPYHGGISTEEPAATAYGRSRRRRLATRTKTAPCGRDSWGRWGAPPGSQPLCAGFVDRKSGRAVVARGRTEDVMSD